jgi:hypothetical protein
MKWDVAYLVSTPASLFDVRHFAMSFRGASRSMRVWKPAMHRSFTSTSIDAASGGRDA